jgi:hypothetical protein
MHSETHPATAGRPLITPHSASILFFFVFTIHHPASPRALAMASESAGYITDPDEQPFSPSVFLNLPPTPPDDGQDPAASSDDLVLPFVSRILMDDDDDDDKLSYQCPDHQALLQAQQPFAEILSDTTTTTNTNVATSTFTVSPFFPNNTVSAFGTATWPYDPVELSLQLLSRTPYRTTSPTTSEESDVMASPSPRVIMVMPTPPSWPSKITTTPPAWDNSGDRTQTRPTRPQRRVVQVLVSTTHSSSVVVR